MDVLFLASAVHPMTGADPGSAPADALAVTRGRVAAVGPRHELLTRRTAATEVIDLGRGVVLPGLVEPHTHPDLCAQVYAWVDVSGFTHRTAASVEATLREAVATTPDGEWIFAFGLDFLLTAGLDGFDRHRLDAISDRHPIFVMIQSMHTAYVNSMALDRAGVDDRTPDPAGGGHYDRDDDGRPTGRMEEAPTMPPFLRFVDESPTAVEARLRQQYQRYRDVGITAIGVAGLFTSRDLTPTSFRVASDPTSPIRTTTYLRHNRAADLPRYRDLGERHRVPGVKLWYDGSPYTGTMLLDEPYLDTNLCCCVLGIPAGSTGRANFAPEELGETLAELAAGGWQVLTHAQGDRGCREILDLYADALHHAPSLDLRWRLEHCALITGDDLQRAAHLGVAPSFHMNHVLHYGPELRDQILGPERADRLMPMADALACGHRPSLHADSPMYPPGPLTLARTAATRLTRHGDTVGPGQAVTVEAAIRAVTLDAAWQLGLDGEIGSLEVGKRADFTVLDADPFAVAPSDLDRIEVRGTWLDGRPS